MKSAIRNLAEISAQYGCREKTWLNKYSRLFAGTDLDGKAVVDIGAGVGWASFYAAVSGATRVVMIEPEIAGSRNYMLAQARAIRSELGFERTVEILPITFEDSDVSGYFDVVVIDNAINHFAENACVAMSRDWAASKEYHPLILKIRDLLCPGGKLIVTDCSNRNFFGDIGLKSPLAPTIEWHKHQPPMIWARLFSDFGFIDPKVTWTPVARLGFFGRFLGTNKLGAYFTSSHFRLVMRRAD